MNFSDYLEKTKEVGYVEQTSRSIVYVSGLPGAHPSEMVVFEGGGTGEIISLKEDAAEILLFEYFSVSVGARVARTGEILKISVGDFLIGKTVTALGKYPVGEGTKSAAGEAKVIDITPLGLTEREKVTQPLFTGVSLVDLILPLARGQRELVIGNRRTGKTEFLLQTVLTQARAGTLCIYCAVAKRTVDVEKIKTFLSAMDLWQNTILVVSYASDPIGLIYSGPYTAMTIAEYFRDQGRDTLVIFDDLIAHAKCYREISLLARRFPGRNSYPGDIFYTHSRLIERAGNFKKGSISTLVVAETVLSDISGYIQTNLMSMTDGHLYFDSDLYNQGRRPAINPFISVTRVGRQTQTPLLRDINRKLTRFLVNVAKLHQFMHFGAELSEQVRSELALGEKFTAFFDQGDSETISINTAILVSTLLWGGMWKEETVTEAKIQMKNIMKVYCEDKIFAAEVDKIISGTDNLIDLSINFKGDAVIAKKLLEMRLKVT
jgi:F-type H+-transporting ATPase subunit alpha